MAETFKAGDVVELKSGGTKMTISATSPDATDKVWCCWFDPISGQIKLDIIIPKIILKLSS